MNQIILTDDNSPTLFSDTYRQTYHSSHGAIQESEHVFIQNGLAYHTTFDSIKVLEMGFGTGLNVLLAWNYALLHAINIEITTIEKYPIDKKTIDVFQAKLPSNQDLFEKIHLASWDQHVVLDAHFTIKKLANDIFKVSLPPQYYHTIFYDAFSPEAQPVLWERKIMESMYRCLIPKGILVTYCAKGVVKRTLTSIGFQVQNLPGPPGKREMIRAIKP